MYIKDRFHQLGLSDFNQPIGLRMNPENRWIKKAAAIPWFAFEDRYAELFPSKNGMPVKPLPANDQAERLTSAIASVSTIAIVDYWQC